MRNLPWTMMRGEILKDLCRLAVYTATPDRLFVYVESPDFLATSLVLDLYHFDLDGDELNLPPAAMARLLNTATAIIGSTQARVSRDRSSHPADRLLTTFAFGKRSGACSQFAPTCKGSAHARPFRSPRSRSPSSGGI